MLILFLCLATIITIFVAGCVAMAVLLNRTVRERNRLRRKSENQPYVAKGAVDYDLYKKETTRQDHQRPYPTKTVRNIRRIFDNIKRNPPALFPTDAKGRGIVVVAGGFKYLTCALVLIDVLRQHGCKLPVEVFHLKDELPEGARSRLLKCNAEPRDLSDVVDYEWEGQYTTKILAVRHSRFREVLLLDADNNCLRDPAYLFDCREFKQHGAIFWPDFWHLDRNAPIFDAYDDPPVSEFAQESGQLLIDKKRCAAGIEACLQIHLRHYADFDRLSPVPDSYGDKDVWMSSWLGTGTPFFMVSHPTSGIGRYESTGTYMGNSMGQKDPSGEMLFLHKNLQKWHAVHSFSNWDLVMSSSPGDSSRWVDRSTWELYGETVKVFSFCDLFGNFEDVCWTALESIRREPWYKKAYGKLIPRGRVYLREPIAMKVSDIRKKKKKKKSEKKKTSTVRG